jgi:hypothetical protein
MNLNLRRRGMPVCVSLRERAEIQDLKSEADKKSPVFFTTASRPKSKFYIVTTWEGIDKSIKSKDLTVWKIGCLQISLQTNSDCLKPSVF